MILHVGPHVMSLILHVSIEPVSQNPWRGGLAERHTRAAFQKPMEVEEQLGPMFFQSVELEIRPEGFDCSL